MKQSIYFKLYCAIAVLFIINCLTAGLYTTVWMDEVIFVDPAANLYYGRGFVSTAWLTQSNHEFWSGNPPLYPALLAQWFNWVGFGMFQTKLFNLVVWTVGVVLTCTAVKRFQFIKSSTGLCLLAVTLFLGQGVAFDYRDGRYDSLMFLLSALCFYSLSIKNERWRYGMLFLSAACLLPTGTVLGPYAVVIAAWCFAFASRRHIRELVVFGIGLAAGWVFLCVFYSAHGTLSTFLHTTQYVKNLPVQIEPHHSVVLQKALAFGKALGQDKSGVIVFAVLLALLPFGFKGWDSSQKRLVGFSLSLFFLVSGLYVVIYKFPITYCWMVYVPLCVGLIASMEAGSPPAFVRYRGVVYAILFVGLSLSGLPWRLVLGSLDLAERDYGRVEAFVGKTVHPTDVVFADYQAFYALHKVHATSYYKPYLNIISRKETEAVTCLVIDPASLPEVQTELGGNWQPTGEAYLHEGKFQIPLLDRLLPGYFSQQTNCKYNLAVFRRHEK